MTSWSSPLKRDNLLALGDSLDRPELVPEPGGPLELPRLGGPLHLVAQVPDHGLRAALHEQHHLVDDLAVLLPARRAYAGGHTAVDEMLKARPRVVTANLPCARAVGEQLLEQRHGLADGAGAGVWAEVTRAVVGYASGNVDLRKVLVEADLEVGVGLVVLEACVVLGAPGLDERVLENEGLGLGLRDDELEVGNSRDQLAYLRLQVRGRSEV